MNEIACATGVELLMEYLEGVLPADVHAALEEHVAGCSKCRAFVASYVQTPAILRQVSAPALPAEVEASLRAFLRARTTAFRSN